MATKEKVTACIECGTGLPKNLNDNLCKLCREEVDFSLKDLQRDLDLCHIQITLNHIKEYKLETEFIYSIWKITRENPRMKLENVISLAHSEWLK